MPRLDVVVASRESSAPIHTCSHPSENGTGPVGTIFVQLPPSPNLLCRPYNLDDLMSFSAVLVHQARFWRITWWLVRLKRFVIGANIKFPSFRATRYILSGSGLYWIFSVGFGLPLIKRREKTECSRIVPRARWEGNSYSLRCCDSKLTWS